MTRRGVGNGFGKGFLIGVMLLVATPGHAEPYEAKGKWDPFVPLVRDGRFIAAPGGGDFSNLTLVGILWDPSGQSLALINDMEAKVGDVLGDYQVQEIRQDGVVLMRDGKPVVLQLSFETAPQAVASSDKHRRSER